MDKKVRGWKILKLAVPDEITDSDEVNDLSICKAQETAKDVTNEEIEPEFFDIDLPVLDVAQVLTQDYTMDYYEINGREILIDNQNFNGEVNVENNQECIPDFNENEINLNEESNPRNDHEDNQRNMDELLNSGNNNEIKTNDNGSNRKNMEENSHPGNHQDFQADYDIDGRGNLNEENNQSNHEDSTTDSDEYGNMEEGRKIKSKSTPSSWKRGKNKKLRMKGEAYIGFRKDKDSNKIKQDVLRNKRELGPRCTSEFCKNQKKCHEVTEEVREKIFQKFWQDFNWDQRKVFVSNNVVPLEPKRRYTKSVNSRRGCTLSYNLIVDNVKVPICKNMFLNTLGLGQFQVFSWAKNNAVGMPSSKEAINELRPQKKSIGKIFLKKFLDELPKLPSHYCRMLTNKLYLDQTITSVTQLYKMYIEKSANEQQTAVSRRTFDEEFHRKNISIYQPKKDKCDTCTKFEVGNLDVHEYNEHIQKKNRAREEKSGDKKLAAKGKCTLIMMDLQAVKVCPNIQASAVYYRTKLCCHNFSVMNVITKHVMCYWFSEVDSDLTASSFASCLVNYINNHCSAEKEKVVIFSDGCTYQNRNSIMSNALLSISVKNKIIIEQKFLEKGHTQMECDSIHSSIERKLKGREIYLPSDYISVTKEARHSPSPYGVKWVEFNEFKDYSDKKNQVFSSIRPGTLNVVTDIRGLQYLPSGDILFKLNFDENWKILPQRKLKQQPTTDWPQLNSKKKKISKQKWKHLQELKSVIPSQCHSYYDNLEHE